VSILLSATALLLGFHLGLRRESQAIQTERNGDRGQADGDKSEEGTMDDENLSAVQAGMMEPCKLVRSSPGEYFTSFNNEYSRLPIFEVLVVRTDLNMTPGTIATQ